MPNDLPIRLSRFAGVLSLAVLFLAAGPALGQPSGGLPSELSAAPTLTQPQRQQVQSFVTRQVEGLRAGEPGRVEAARDALLAPLNAADVSVAFRLAMSAALAPELATLARQQDDRLAFNALRLAGALATDAAVDIIRNSLGDERPSVRYGAALGARMTMEAAATGRSPLPQNQTDALVTSLKDAVQREKNPEVFGGLVAAMTSVDSGGAGRTRALVDLSQIVGQRLAAEKAQEGSPDWARAYQRAIGAAQNAVTEQLQSGTLDRTFAKAYAGASGQALAYAARRLSAPQGVAGPERSALRELVASAEFGLLLIDADLGRRQHSNRLLLEAFDASATEGPKPFRDEATKWIGAQGHLTKDPYERANFDMGG